MHGEQCPVTSTNDRNDNTVDHPTTKQLMQYQSPIYMNWSMTGAPANSQVIFENTLVNQYANVFDATYESNRLIPISPGDSSGSLQWQVGPTYWTVPGIFEVTAYVRQCNSGGCNLGNAFSTTGQSINHAQSASVATYCIDSPLPTP